MSDGVEVRSMLAACELTISRRISAAVTDISLLWRGNGALRSTSLMFGDYRARQNIFGGGDALFWRRLLTVIIYVLFAAMGHGIETGEKKKLNNQQGQKYAQLNSCSSQ